jgi:hypothetical protein
MIPAYEEVPLQFERTKAGNEVDLDHLQEEAADLIDEAELLQDIVEDLAVDHAAQEIHLKKIEARADHQVQKIGIHAKLCVIREIQRMKENEVEKGKEKDVIL